VGFKWQRHSDNTKRDSVQVVGSMARIRRLRELNKVRLVGRSVHDLDLRQAILALLDGNVLLERNDGRQLDQAIVRNELTPDELLGIVVLENRSHEELKVLGVVSIGEQEPRVAMALNLVFDLVFTRLERKEESRPASSSIVSTRQGHVRVEQAPNVPERLGTCLLDDWHR